MENNMLSEKYRGLSPDWVTGFTDAEGCFTVSAYRCNLDNGQVRQAWRVILCFEIELPIRDLDLLYQIKSFFNGSGNVSVREQRKSAIYQIRDLKSIVNEVITHFNKYPLISQKQIDFKLFCMISEVLSNNKKFSDCGIMKIKSLWGTASRLAIPRGNSQRPSEKLQGESTLNYKLHSQDEASLKVDYELRNITCDWLSGFMSGDGCFFVNIYKVKNCKTGYAVKLSISITQHLKNKVLMENITRILTCGQVYKHSNNTVVLKICTFKDIINIIIPLFEQYPIRGIKSRDFKDFCLIASKVQRKTHLNIEGLEEIREIKLGMNSRRS
uniref:LAGLIDADG endonuclease n=1 Tax=Fusarium begoniae TaxID=48487 RepID=A0A6M4B022_9HYPO|nr:LAGLIDADG endonuclease [Fusarium begoniae]